jgi:uncharacterized SAM-binding protein YcdF (DUF218 family)
MTPGSATRARVARRFAVAVRRALATAALAPIAVALTWIAGFVWFCHVATRPPPASPSADGIVVLTGGADRVSTGLRLLAEGSGRLLLVSGVNPAAAFSDLAHLAGADESLRPRVTLGRAALDTHGNAVETASWARANDIHSLILVTAGYHMPRALAELSRTLPDVTIHPFPVLSPVLRGAPDASSLRLLAGEYTKWLVAEARLAGLPIRVAERDQSSAAGEPGPRGINKVDKLGG